MRKAAKVRLYPTTEQKQILAKQFGCARFWWNKALGLQYEHRFQNGKWLKRTELNAMLPQLKQELPWLKTDCYSQVLQATTKHLEQAMKNWFEGRAKKPRYLRNVRVIGGRMSMMVMVMMGMTIIYWC